MLLSQCANQVLQEFGGAMPESLVSFEDASREFLSVRALELQKLGVATTDYTVTKTTLSASDRDGLLSPIFGDDMIPAWVEATPANSSNNNIRYKVAIITPDLIPAYEGARAIAFYGNPKRYRLSWDAWDDDTVTIYYDPVEDLTAIGQADDLTFPQAFWTLLFKKAALNTVRVALVKLALVNPSEFQGTKSDVVNALNSFVGLLAPQVAEWEHELRRYRALDLNTQPHLRRTQDELALADYNNVSRANPLDFIG